MSRWKWSFGVLLLLFWAVLAVWVLFGGSPSEQAVAVARSLLPEYFTLEKPRSYLELTAIFPEPIALFLYTFEKYILIYIGIAAFGTLMLGFSLRRAMTIVREMPEAPVSEPGFTQKPLGLRAKLRLLAALVFMKQGLARLQSKSQSLAWSMAVKLTGLIAAVGLLIMLVVYHSMSGALKEQAVSRVLTIVRNLSDGAATHSIKKDLAALDALAARYASLDDVAYVYIQDMKGKVLAYAAADPPPRFSGARKGRGTLIFRGAEVLEMQAPVLDGKSGSVRVGIWRAAIDQASAATFPLIAVLCAIVAAAAALSFFLVRKVTGPILRLARLANQIGRGNFDIPVEAPSNDEIGDLALDLERMRSSLKASMDLVKRLQSEKKQKK